MKFSRVFAVILSLSVPLAVAGDAQAAPDPVRSAFAAQTAAAEKQNATAVAGIDGWLFLASECRMLSVGPFWGEAAAKVSRSPKPEAADPIPAIVHFQQQLKERGIELLLVPVPPKAVIYPEKIVPGIGGDDPALVLVRFYEELRVQGVDVLDLTETFRKHRNSETSGPVFCKTDTHWSGYGCVLAAEAIAERVRSKIAAPKSPTKFEAQWKEVGVDGDLPALLPTGAPKPEAEKIQLRMVSEKGTGKEVVADENSPVLLLGDSHTLVFHEFLGTQSGLIDQLAAELHFAPDLIGIRGSGATQVRKDLYRRSVRTPDYLTKKKVVVWCFTAREFSEADQGWQKLPVAK